MEIMENLQVAARVTMYMYYSNSEVTLRSLDFELSRPFLGGEVSLFL